MNNGSSNKAFIFVVVAVIVVIAAWFMMRDQGGTMTPEVNDTNTQTQNTTEDMTSTIRSSGVSDSSFDEDQAIIDAQLDLLNQETLDAAQ